MIRQLADQSQWTWCSHLNFVIIHIYQVNQLWINRWSDVLQKADLSSTSETISNFLHYTKGPKVFLHLYISIITNDRFISIGSTRHMNMWAACIHTHTNTGKPWNKASHTRVLPNLHLLVWTFAVTVLAVMGATVTPQFTPLAALPALFLVLSLLLVDDLHFQAADVERYCTEPEEGGAAHHGALEQQRWHGQQQHPPQGKEASNVWGGAERHTCTSQQKEGWGKASMVLMNKSNTN